MTYLKNNLTLLVASLTAVLLLVAPTSANALLIVEGDPLEGNSWEQRFVESGFEFDTIEAWVVADEQIEVPYFEAPGLVDFSHIEWIGNVVAPQCPDFVSGALGTGPAVDELYFTMHFSGDIPSDPFLVYYEARYQDELRNSADIYWSGEAWQITNYGDFPPGYDVALVPEPATMLLLGAGLLGLAGVGRKKLFRG